MVLRPLTVSARIIEADDKRKLIQMRVDLGLIQMEYSGRPDGLRPEGLAPILIISIHGGH